MGRGYFWVGKDLHETGGGTVPFGQMYVEWEKPDGPGRDLLVPLPGAGRPDSETGPWHGGEPP